MAEHENDRRDEPVTYASPLKRIWAWVGVVYMVFLACLVTYSLAFGAFLRGIGGIMVAPALAGMAASFFSLWRSGVQPLHRRMFFVLMMGLCIALMILSLWEGIPALVAGFGVR